MQWKWGSIKSFLLLPFFFPLSARGEGVSAIGILESCGQPAQKERRTEGQKRVEGSR